MSTTIDDLKNTLLPASQRSSGPVAISQGVESDRAIAMIQGQMTLAKRFPRDQGKALTAILESCQLVPVAEDAHYSFPRGGSVVDGVSIDLMRMIAREWGNIIWNVRELERRIGESTAVVYAIDLETNTMSQREFIVRHIRDKNDESGQNDGKALKSERDIYELIANMGARRVRACLEDIIPPHIIGAASARCYQTLKEVAEREPMIERLKKLVPAFKAVGVTEPMLVKHLGGRPLGEMLEKEYIQLRNIYRSISTGAARVDEFFDQPTVADSVAAGKATQKQPSQDKAAGGDQQPTQTRNDAAHGGGAQAHQPAAGAGAAAQQDPPADGPPSKEEMISKINACATVDQINAFNVVIKAAKHLSAADMKAVKAAAGARVKQIQDAEAEAYRRASGDDDGSAPE